MPIRTVTDERLRGLAERALTASMAHGTAGLAAWGLYMAEVRELVNHYRGLELADMIYLHGWKLRDVVDELAAHDQVVSHQGINDWLDRSKPAHYLTVGHRGKTYDLKKVPVSGIVQTRRELGAMRDAGRRIVPARWEIGEDADARELWERLDPDEG